ncbi:MAG: mannose-1-phosphate guanylyltransferase/mannose-6-phosphate isomerase [Zetaproteobacteria bacterium CG_4_9_14_3_um_filter_53_7]|nr:MAG: mannose-1-phosphate guanylyltransferase/mannose-6-phosphate isomerase [Zetaproteobacteria bacterium CG_4_9_14_3_um_filter_53_7]
MSQLIRGLILAGGSGTRLWPLSRQQLPKQFLYIDGIDSMLSATISRLSPLVSRDNAWVVTGETHASGEAFSELDGLNLILEPCARNTAPAIAVAAALFQDLTREDPIMVVLPADHIIAKQSAFQGCLRKAVDAAAAGKLVTFGIVPDHPETGFGYVQTEASDTDVHHVLRFVEKPDLARAQAMLADGNYFWNSGMFVWKASTILEEMATYLPEVCEVLNVMRARWKRGEPWQEVIRDSFDRMPNISIDYGIMEKSRRVSLVSADIGWSDVGSWDAVHEMVGSSDANGNAISGNVLAIDCKGSLLRSEKNLIAAVGLENIIAVETPDAILLCKAGDSQRVKDVVDALKLGKGDYHLKHVTVRRPWGSYTILEGGASGYTIKRIEVLPGARLSLQSHQHRSEHWVVVEGTATVTCGALVKTVPKNGSAYIPLGEIHRLENKGRMLLQLIEVQVGDYLDEDDIERFDDIYGRVKK